MPPVAVAMSMVVVTGMIIMFVPMVMMVMTNMIIVIVPMVIAPMVIVPVVVMTIMIVMIVTGVSMIARSVFVGMPLSHCDRPSPEVSGPSHGAVYSLIRRERDSWEHLPGVGCAVKPFERGLRRPNPCRSTGTIHAVPTNKCGRPPFRLGMTLGVPRFTPHKLLRWLKLGAAPLPPLLPD